jgi:excisionase family DNA binding protein
MASHIEHPDGAALLSPEQVARLCGLSRRAVYDAIKRGELQAFRLCSRLRISTEDLAAWLSESAVPAADSGPRPETRVGSSTALVRRGSFRAKLAATRQRE